MGRWAASSGLLRARFFRDAGGEGCQRLGRRGSNPAFERPERAPHSVGEHTKATSDPQRSCRIAADNLTGLPDAIGVTWLEAIVQLCVVHTAGRTRSARPGPRHMGAPMDDLRRRLRQSGELAARADPAVGASTS